MALFLATAELEQARFVFWLTNTLDIGPHPIPNEKRQFRDGDDISIRFKKQKNYI